MDVYVQREGARDRGRALARSVVVLGSPPLFLIEEKAGRSYVLSRELGRFVLGEHFVRVRNSKGYVTITDIRNKLTDLCGN